MSGTGPQVVVPSAARTTNGNSGPLQIGGVGLAANLQVTVTAIAGTPNMVLSVLWSDDGVNFGAADGTPDTFAAITGATTVAKQVTVKGLYMQINWVITGTTPSLTFFIEAS